MKRAGLAGIVAAGATIACIVFVVILFAIKALWAWTIPDLFPGAVEHGLVARSISWLTAGKIALLVAVLSAIAGGHQAQKKS